MFIILSNYDSGRYEVLGRGVIYVSLCVDGGFIQMYL